MGGDEKLPPEQQALLTASALIMRAMAFKGRFLTKGDLAEIFTHQELVELRDAVELAHVLTSRSGSLDDHMRGVLTNTRRMLKEILDEGS